MLIRKGAFPDALSAISNQLSAKAGKKPGLS
jgi:hypothetical protein